jgi:hypothetical protein
MDNDSYEKMLANEVHYSQWKDQVKEPEMRFHSSFDFKLPSQNWKLLQNRSTSLPEVFVLSFIENKYVSVNDTGLSLLMQFALCESVRAAREYLFSSLLKITNPNFPMEYPNKVQIGDVYFGGYWVRDNLFISIRNLSSKPIPEKDVQAISALIDAELLKIPAVHTTPLQEIPEIRNLHMQSKTIPLGETVPIQFSLHDSSCTIDQLRLLFQVTGGQVSSKGGMYLFRAEKPGKQVITAYVTNPRGKTSKASIEVSVVE